MKISKILLIIFGSLATLFSFVLIAVGVSLLIIDGSRDKDGYISNSQFYYSHGNAVVSNSPTWYSGIGDSLPNSIEKPGPIKIQATSNVNGLPIFVGIGPTDKINAYLNGFTHQQITEKGDDDPTILFPASRQTPKPPSSQNFWIASASGSGTLTLTYPKKTTNLSSVVMGPTGTTEFPGFSVTVSESFPAVFNMGIGFLIAGLIILTIGILMIIFGARKRKKPSAAPDPSDVFELVS
jgi:uncharacterized membrane protein